MEKLVLTYEQLYNLYGNGNHEDPCEVKDEVYVKTPTGYAPIQYVVCKHDNPVIHIDFDDNTSFECSETHIFSCDGNPVYANEAETVDTIHGKLNVVEKFPLGNETVYDISIPAPHWYISNEKQGLIHHNTYIALTAVKTFLENNPDGQVLYFDTEFALEKSMLGKRGFDMSRFHVIQVDHLQDFRTKAVKILDAYEEKKSKPPMMFVLDSLSNLPTLKELQDAASGSEARDMTKAQIIRSIFRVITQKLGKNNVPMIITNHVYSSMDAYSPVQISGGDGAKYAASTIITLSKSKDRDGTEVVGNIIKATAYKSRYTKENKTVQMQLDYSTGLNKYYGLLELAEKAGIFKKVSTRYELSDGTKVFGKTINENPEKYFTKDILDKLDAYAKIEFSLGEGRTGSDDIDLEDTETLENNE